jgi:phosphate:Na+ symporter
VDLFNAKKVMVEHFIELRSDILLLIRDLSSHTLNLFDSINKSLLEEKELDIKAVSQDLQACINRTNRNLLSLLADPNRRDAGALTNFVTYSQRLKDKLVNFANTSRLD